MYLIDFFKVIKAKILKRKQTGPSQTDDVVYTVKIIQNYKVSFYIILGHRELNGNKNAN